MNTEFYNSNQFKAIMSSLAQVASEEENQNHHPTTADYVVDPFADGIILCATTTTTTEPMMTDEGTTTTSTATPVIMVDEEQEPTTSTTTVVVPSTSTEEEDEKENNNKIIEYPDGHQLTLKGGGGGGGVDNGGGGPLDSSSSSTGHTCANTTVEYEEEEENSASSSFLSLSSSSSFLSSSHNEGNNNNNNVAIDKKKKEGDKEQELLELDEVVVEEGGIVIDPAVPSPTHVDETFPPAADTSVPPHVVDDDNEPDVDITAAATTATTATATAATTATAAAAAAAKEEEEGGGEVEVGESKIMVPDAPPPPTEEKEVEEVEEYNNILHATPPSPSSTIKSNDNEQVGVVIVDTVPDVDVDVDAAAHALSVEEDGNNVKPTEEGAVPNEVVQEKNKNKIPSAAEQMVSLLWASSSKSNTEVPAAATTSATTTTTTTTTTSCSSTDEVYDSFADGGDVMVCNNENQQQFEKAEGEKEDNNYEIVEGIVIDEDNANEGGILFSTTIENIDDDDDDDDDESIEEITIADEVEEYNDEDDGMSVSTPGEFFGITAHIEVSSDFMTTTNNDNHYHHDGRSYDEITADDCELYDENTIDDEVVVDEDTNDGDDGDDIPDRVVNDSDVVVLNDIPKNNSNSNPEMKGIEEIVVDPDPDLDDPSFDDDDDLVDVAAAKEGADGEQKEVEKVALVVEDAPMEEEQDENNTTLLALPPSTIQTIDDNEQAEDDTPLSINTAPDDYVDAAAKEGGEEDSVAPLVKSDIEEETTNDNTLESQPSIKMTNDVDDEEESVDDKPKHSMTMKIGKKDGDELQEEEEEEEVNHDKVPNNNDKTMNVKNDDDDQKQKGVVAEGTSTTTTTALDDELPSPSPLTPTMSIAERMKKMFDSSSPDEPSMAFGNNSDNKSISIAKPTCTSVVKKAMESTSTFSTASAFTDDDNGINNTIVQKVDKNEKKPNDKVLVPKVAGEKKIPSAAEQMVSVLWASSSKSKKVPAAASNTTMSCSGTEVDPSDGGNSGESDTIVQLDSTSTDLVKLDAQGDDTIVVAEEDVTASQKENIDENRIVIDDDCSGPATAVADSTSLPITASQSKQKDAVFDLAIVCNSTNSGPPVADATSRKKNKLSDRLNMFDSPTNSKSNAGNIPPAFTNKQPSWRKEKPSTNISKAGGADNKPLVVVNKTSQEEKVVTDVEKSSPSATSTVCHDKELLVEHIVSLLNESGRMQNKNLLASRIVSLLGGDDEVIGGMMVKSVMATTNNKYYSTDSLDTTPHSSRSRFDDGSLKVTTRKNLTVRTNIDEEEVEADEADAYILRKKDSFKDPGLKKMRNDSLEQKEKLRRCDDPDSISMRKMKRFSIKGLKLKRSESTAKENADEQQQQRPEEQKSTSSLSPVAIDGNNNRNDALLAEKVMARIWPKDKVRPSPSSKVSNCPMKKTPSTKKLGDRLKMFDCPLPEASSSPSWSSSSSSPRSGYTTSSFKINSPNNEKTTATSNITTLSTKDDSATASSIIFLASSITERNEISRNTLKKLSSFQRLWRRVNKSKKNTSAKDCSGSVSSLSSTASLPTSKPMTNSEPPTPTTTNNKKIIVGNNNGVNNEVYYTLDDFEQKRHGEIDMERWEYYLHDEEFQKCFNGLTKEQFYLQPKWKQDKQKWKLRVAF